MDPVSAGHIAFYAVCFIGISLYVIVSELYTDSKDDYHQVDRTFLE